MSFTTRDSRPTTGRSSSSNGNGKLQPKVKRAIMKRFNAAASVRFHYVALRTKELWRISSDRMRKSKSRFYLLLIVVVLGLSYENIHTLFSLQESKLSELTLQEQHLVPEAVHTSVPLQHLVPKMVNTSVPLQESIGEKLAPPPVPRNYSSIHPYLHIYWLTDTSNSTKNNGRDRMEKALRTLRLHSNETKSLQARGIVTRIPWWTVEQVAEIYHATNETLKLNATANKRLILTNGVTLKKRSENPKPPGSYSFEEGARLVTHLTALGEAFEAGHEQVLIVQDNTILTQAFFDHWHEYAALAPKDWTVLQWMTSNVPTLEQSVSLPEPWISWLPDLWSVHAYTINRIGLEAIRRRLVRPQKGTTDSSKKFHYTVDDGLGNIFLADELLFSVPDQRAYTSTYPWVVSDEIRGSLDRSTPLGSAFAKDPPNLPLPTMSKPFTRNETLLVFMNIRCTTSKRMGLEMDRALLDFEAVCGVHPKCDWIIHLVFTKEYLLKGFNEVYLPTLPSNFQFKITVGDKRFNKFGLLKDHLKTMSQYDLVLVKDNDQRLAGFPWYSFLKEKGNALVSGPLRQAPDESFAGTSIWDKNQYYKLHDAQAWKKRGFAPWATRLFVNGSAIEVPFLEMYFNLFDGKYAEWFFSQVLTKNFTEQDSCWGPDFLWCAGAKDYGKSTGQGDRMGCALVPFVSVHEDTRQILKDGEAFNQRGFKAVENLKSSNATFLRWYNTAFKYTRGVIAWRQLDAIGKQCLKLLSLEAIQLGRQSRDQWQKLTSPSRLETLDFRACIDAGMNRAKII